MVSTTQQHLLEFNGGGKAYTVAGDRWDDKKIALRLVAFFVIVQHKFANRSAQDGPRDHI